MPPTVGRETEGGRSALFGVLGDPSGRPTQPFSERFQRCLSRVRTALARTVMRFGLMRELRKICQYYSRAMPRSTGGRAAAPGRERSPSPCGPEQRSTTPLRGTRVERTRYGPRHHVVLRSKHEAQRPTRHPRCKTRSDAPSTLPCSPARPARSTSPASNSSTPPAATSSPTGTPPSTPPSPCYAPKPGEPRAMPT